MAKRDAPRRGGRQRGMGSVFQPKLKSGQRGARCVIKYYSSRRGGHHGAQDADRVRPLQHRERDGPGRGDSEDGLGSVLGNVSARGWKSRTATA